MKKFLLFLIILLAFYFIYYSNNSIAERAFKTKDYTKAMKYYILSCDDDKNFISCRQVSSMYNNEEIIHPNISKEVTYELKACFYGASCACLNLYYRNDLRKITNWLPIKKVLYIEYITLMNKKNKEKYEEEKIIAEIKKQVSKKAIELGIMKLQKNGKLEIYIPTQLDRTIERINNPSLSDRLKKAI